MRNEDDSVYNRCVKSAGSGVSLQRLEGGRVTGNRDSCASEISDKPAITIILIIIFMWLNNSDD